MFVRNINFKLTENDVLNSEALKQFGEIESVSLNKKQKGDGHRGSAFVKFKEAASAKLAAEISSKFWDKKLEWSEK